jgi:coenzyme F420-0:L-glutamate ligase/coenzyme F420-1:gamma-L-glutamate ligase
MFKTNRMTLEIIPVKIQKEINHDDDLVDLIIESSEINDGDILVFSQKIVSKNEGRILSLSSVNPSFLANGIASSYGKDPRLVELILSESKRIVRMENGIIIVETNHGFICANAGIDESNVQDGYATLLPDNPDQSADLLKSRIEQKTGKQIAVIISDTFGRPFRLGQTDVAIGIAGLEPILDYEGKPDTFGKIMQVTAIAVADEICSASELVMGKVEKCPIAIVRNYNFNFSNAKIQKLLRSKHDDLFR